MPVPQKDSGKSTGQNLHPLGLQCETAWSPSSPLSRWDSFLACVTHHATMSCRHRHRQPRAYDSQLRADWNPLGLGHTITIFIVVRSLSSSRRDPPRLGLTMELSVGLMLILLAS